MVFRRRRREPPNSELGIEAFYAWWATASGRVDEHLAAGTASDLVEEVATRVTAIHPALDWEFSAGSRSRHVMVVTAAGVAENRYLAQRWLLAAPAPDEVWEYADARQPTWQPGTVMEMADVRLDLDGVTVAAQDNGRQRLDVQVHHPEMQRLPEQARASLSFLALDWLLGEDAVEQWIGSIDVMVAGPDDAFPASELPGRVQAFVGEAEESWSLMEGGTTERPVLALVRLPHPRFEDLQRIDHVQVRLPYQDQDLRGLPGPTSLDRLSDFEDRAVEVLGEAAVLVAHETTGGVRTLYFYARDGQACAQRLEALVEDWSEGRGAKLKVARDPGWSAVAHLL